MRRLLTACVVVVSFAACGSTAAPPESSAPSLADSELGVGGTTGFGSPVAPAPQSREAATDRGGAEAAGASTSGRPAPDAPAPSAAGAAPIARDPVTVGILYTNNDAAPSAGVDNGNTFSSRHVFEAFVAAYNERGGFAGRQIDPVFVELRSSSVDLQADLQAACATFTQDNDVAVVLSAIGLFSEGFSACLSKAGTTQIAGDYAMGDSTSLAEASTLYAPATTTVDDRLRALLEIGVDTGRISADDDIGVVVESCPYNERAYEATVEPTAARLGLTIVERVDARCFQGIDDLSGLASEMGSTVLRFSTAGVTKVLFVSGSFEGNLMLFFATAAESQGYRPGYALTSAVVPAVQEANTPKAQLANAFGVGWLPAIDSSRAAPTLPAAQRCLEDLAAGAEVAPASPADRYFTFSTCDTFALYEAALRQTSGATDARAVGAAIHGLGTSFAAAALVGEASDFGGGRRTGPARGRVFAWSGSCGCFEYAGEAIELTAR